MPLIRPSIPLNQFSNSTSPSSWRAQIKQNQLITQISSILLQRHGWIPLLRDFDLSTKLTPSIFHHILLKIQKSPQISLSFFHWVSTHIGFQPDLAAHSQIIRITIQSGLFLPAKHILEGLIQTHTVSALVDSLSRACRGKHSESSAVLGFVLECYSNKGLFIEASKVFRVITIHGHMPSVHSCNALLDSLLRENEIKLALCVCGALIRNRVLPDYVRVAQILCANGKLERVVRLLDLGIVCNALIYKLVILCYCESRQFSTAFLYLNEMCNRDLEPDFVTYISILDSACKYGNDEVIQMVMDFMVGKALLPNLPSSEYNSIIQKICNLEKTHAAQMFFNRARDEKIELDNATYGCMLRALATKGRVEEATRVHLMILENGVTVKDRCYHAFVNALCGEDASEEVSTLVGEIIGKGFTPSGLKLSKFVTSLCKNFRWREADDLLNVVIEKGLLPDSFCCSALVEHYCRSRQIDSAIALHDKIKKVQGSLDVATYHVLLNGLFIEKRIEDAVSVFDCMRSQNLLSSRSFTIMVSGMCREMKLRKAMKFHDEMLKMGLKPDPATYRRLISGFK